MQEPEPGLSGLLKGLDSLWPEDLADGGFDPGTLPKVGEMEMAARVVDAHVGFLTSIYQSAAKECRAVMRQRREDDPNFNSSGEENPHSKAYPKAINNDR